MTYTGTKMVAEFLSKTIQAKKTIQARKQWSNIFKEWKEKIFCLPIIIYTVKRFFKMKMKQRPSQTKNKQTKLNKVIISRPELQEMVKEVLKRRKTMPSGNLNLYKGIRSTGNDNYLEIHTYIHVHTRTHTHSRPLNNMSLKCVGPVISRLFLRQ